MRRALLLVALAAAGVVTGRVVALFLEDPALPMARSGPSSSVAAPPGAHRPAAGRSVRRAVAVLHAWDADRAAAYARGDPAALRGLYVPGSRAGVRDLRVLQAYVDRGLVVRGMRTQVLAMRLLAAGHARLRLEVTDRLVGGRAVVRAGRRVEPEEREEREAREEGVGLPRDGPTTSVLELRRLAGEWRLGSVQAA